MMKKILIKKAITYILSAIMILVWCLPVMAANSLNEVQNKKTSIDNQINNKIKEKQKLLKDVKELKSDKEWVASQQIKETTVYQQLVNDIAQINTEISNLDKDIKESENDYNHQKELFKTRLKVMYENSNETIIDILLQSKDIANFFERLEYMLLISKNDEKTIEEIKSLKKDIEYKKQLREQDKAKVQDKADKKQDRLDTLMASRADLENKIREKNSKVAALEKQEDDLLKVSKELENEIKNLQKKGRYIGGNMLWPVPGHTAIVSYFGIRRHPILKKMKMHTGIDIDADKGDSIVAANKGTVIIAKWQNGYGNTIIIDHGGGITTLYAHGSKLLVEAGDEVSAGKVIAKIGSTGLSTGPHLHFEIRVNGEPVDPLKFKK